MPACCLRKVWMSSTLVFWFITITFLIRLTRNSWSLCVPRGACNEPWQECSSANLPTTYCSCFFENDTRT
jgi:hypothetical protein